MDLRACFRRCLDGLRDVRYMDVHEPERMHLEHVTGLREHATVHLIALAVHQVHVAAAHVHLPVLLPAEQRRVELECGFMILRHELVPRHATDHRRTIPRA
ncbi:hypothetical protein D3C83_96250 [compost metagenome]